MSIHSRRNVSLACCVLTGLFCGTNYVFSSWGPQMSRQCGLTALAINMVGISGNLGVYFMSPLSGKLVDHTGQRLALLLSSLTLFCGYFGLHRAYVRGQSDAIKPYILCLYSLLTGIGSSLGASATLNACAKSFPQHRGTSTALPIATYGLSAFVFSRISYLVFPGRTGDFLLVLAISCGSALLIASFFVGVYDRDAVFWSAVPQKKNPVDDTDSETRNLLHEDPQDNPDLAVLATAEVTGWKLFRNRDFQFMMVVVALISGSGLMYINNLGNNLTALFRFERLPDPYPVHGLEQLQAFNVSLLSIFNCAGRIFAGLLSDHLKARYNIHRSSFLVLSGSLFILSSTLVYHNTASATVAWHTSITGFAYGCMFGIAPVICSELFGLQNFSTNWGILSIFPGISGNVYNLLYGKVYDMHSDPVTHECVEGLRCYQKAFGFSIMAMVVASGCAWILLIRHMRERRSMDERHR